jgi:hypothetical protein
MYPEVFPGAFDQNNPEFIAYETLRKLPDTYVVLYSKRLKGGLFGKPECEIDFIVSNQRDVVTCMEVKGGVLSYDGAQDRWLQNGQIMERSPERQATEATHALIRELADELRNANVDWVLCFPQCNLVWNLGTTGVPRSRLIDEGRLANIGVEFSRLEQEVRTTFRRSGMRSKEAHDLIARLTRSIGFVQILGVRIAREADQIVQVTQEQCEVLSDLEVNPRIIIHGSAGTGKTILAQEFAKRLAEKGKSVLLLFFNRGIASKVRYAFEKNSTVNVSTFSSFAKRLVEEYDGVWWEAQKDKNNDFWHLVLPSKLLELPKEQQARFDAIIVDEGQDFKPEWFEYLQTLLKPDPDSRFCVFLDEHQDIFRHWKTFPCSPAPAKKVLTKNCHNTKAIVDFLNGTYPTQTKTFEKSPIGVPVVERLVRGDIDEQTQLVRDIKHLLSNEEIRPGNIVILLNAPKEESSLRETKAIGGIPLESTYAHYDTSAKRIYYSTIEIFKGLEADIVFVLLGNRFNENEIANALYVQGSRAKHALYIYRRQV